MKTRMNEEEFELLSVKVLCGEASKEEVSTHGVARAENPALEVFYGEIRKAHATLLEEIPLVFAAKSRKTKEIAEEVPENVVAELPVAEIKSSPERKGGSNPLLRFIMPIAAAACLVALGYLAVKVYLLDVMKSLEQEVSKQTENLNKQQSMLVQQHRLLRQGRAQERMLREKLSLTQNNFNLVIGEIGEQITANEAMQSQLETLQEQLRGETAEKQSMRNYMENMKQEFASSANEAQLRNVSLGARIADLEQKMAANKESRHALEAEAKTLAENLKQQNQIAQDMEKNNRALTLEIEELKEGMVANDEEAVALKRENVGLKKEIRQNEEMLATMQSKIDEFESAVIAAQTELENLPPSFLEDSPNFAMQRMAETELGQIRAKYPDVVNQKNAPNALVASLDLKAAIMILKINDELEGLREGTVLDLTQKDKLIARVSVRKITKSYTMVYILPAGEPSKLRGGEWVTASLFKSP